MNTTPVPSNTVSAKKRNLLWLWITLPIVALLILGGVGAALLGLLFTANEDTSTSALESIIVENAPGVNGAFVGESSGAAGRGWLINLYVDSGDVNDMTTAVDESLRLTWNNTRFEPAQVSISVTVGSKPTDAARIAGDATDPAPIADRLDPDGEKGINVVRQLIMLENAYLTSEYGPHPSAK